VYYIEVAALEDKHLRDDDPLAQTLAARQRIDWRELRFEPFDAPQVRRTLAQMAQQIAQRVMMQEREPERREAAEQDLSVEEDDQVSRFVPTRSIRSRDPGSARLIGEQPGAASGQPDTQSREAASARVFISYKRHVDPDETLALQLHSELVQAGHEPFIDQTMAIGTDWALEIEQQIAQSDFLLVLLSDASVYSEMVA
jgi:hypothetical protein